MNQTNTIVVMTPSQISFLRELITDGIVGCEFNRDNMRPTMLRLRLAWPPAWIVKDQARRVSRGLYRVSELDDVRALIAQEKAEGNESEALDVNDFDAIAELNALSITNTSAGIAF